MSDKKYPFGAVVRARRHALGLTQETLAERTGGSLRWIQLLESGTQQPSITSFFHLAEGLDCEPGLLIREFQAAWQENERGTEESPAVNRPSGQRHPSGGRHNGA